MENRKLVLLLRDLEESERDDFREFLRSPLHSKRPQLAEMLELMEKSGLLARDGRLSPEDYWQLVYPGKDYNGNLLARLLSEIASELKSFLAFVQYRADKALQGLFTLREYRRRKWRRPIPKALRETEAVLEADYPKDEYYFFLRLQLAVEDYHYKVIHRMGLNDPIFQKAIDETDRFYGLQKIRLNLIAKNYDQLHSTNHNTRLMDDAFIDDEVHGASPMSKVHFMVHRVLASGSQLEPFTRFRKELVSLSKTQMHLANLEDWQVLYSMGLNLISRSLNENKLEWMPEFKAMVENGLELGILTHDGELEIRQYLFYAGIYSRNGYTDWALKFIKKYSGMLNDPKGVVVELAFAMTIFFQKKYLKSKQLFYEIKSKINYKTDTMVQLSTRIFACKTWYELDDLDSFVYEIQSLNAQLKRMKAVSQRRLEPYKHFCRMSVRLEKIVNGSKEEKGRKLQLLEESIGKTSMIQKAWLFEKIEQERVKGT